MLTQKSEFLKHQVVNLTQPMKNVKAVIAASTLCLALLGIALPAKADTQSARCDFYPAGSDQASDYGPCTFSQRQGYISIQRSDGTRYEFRPVGDQPGNYENQYGEAVYRESGLGDAGLIFRLPQESIFVYWDSQSNNDTSYTPTTYVSVQNSREIAIQITEGEFKFWGILTRGESGSFIGGDNQVEVIFSPENGHVVVISRATGDEFYSYYTDPIPSLENPYTMCDSSREPC